MIIVSGKWHAWESCYDFVSRWQYLESSYFFHPKQFVGGVGAVVTIA